MTCCSSEVVTAEADKWRSAVMVTAHGARFALLGRAGAAGARLGLAQLKEVLAGFERNEARRFLAKVKVELADGGDPLASLLRRSDTLRRFMDDELKLVHMVGNVGASFTRAMPVEEACARILTSVALHSLEEVVAALASFLRSGTFPMRTLHLVKGAKVRDAIRLDASAVLVPYGEVRKRAAWDETPTGANIPEHPGTSVCGLVLDADVRPGAPVHYPDGMPLEEIAGLDAQEGENARLCYSGVAEFGPDFICAMLTLVSGKLFVPFGRYEVIPEVYSDSLPMFAATGSQGVSNTELSIFPSPAELLFVDSEELIELVTDFSQASDDVRRHLLVPLARLRRAREKAGDVDRAIDLHIAFEALLGRPKSYERKRRAAWLYAEAADEVEFVKRTIQEFSAHRNRIVHGELFSENPELVAKAESILVVCIKWIIRNRRIPLWSQESSIMGNPPVADPGSLRSIKHDTTSWSVAQAREIDEALSQFWMARVSTESASDAPPDSRDGDGSVVAAHGVGQRPDWSELMAAHPYWQNAVETGDKARIFHCEADVQRHLRLWHEALAKC